MRHLSALSVPVAVALALAAGASFAQERPNTTLVQKSKATAASSKAGKTTPQASAQRGSAGGTVDAKSVTPAATQTAPSTGSMPHDCQGGDSDA
jgi:hypothetical protein